MSLPVVPYQCTAGPSEEIAACVIRKVSASLSIFGSSYILSTVWKKYRHNKRSIDPYQRIVVGMSVYDLIWSFWPWFMGSWLTPAETGWWGAVGNTQTCSLQGFFFWIGVPGAQYYQIVLALHTLLLVSFRWKPREFKQKIERWAHKVIFFVAVVLASVPLFFQGYNPECGVCLPAPMPLWCGTWLMGDGETECVRGEPKLSQAYYTIYLTNLSIMGVFCTLSMVTIYLSVRRQEDRAARYLSFRTDVQRRESKRILRVMILFTFSMYLCFVVPSFIIHFAPPGSPAHVVSYILLPLQGFFNMLVFIAPKCSRYQKDHPGMWYITAYLHVIFDPSNYMCCRAASRQVSRIGTSMRHSRESLRNSGSRMTGITLTPVTEAMTDFEDEDDGLGFNMYNEDPRGDAFKARRAAALEKAEKDPEAPKDVAKAPKDKSERSGSTEVMSSFNTEKGKDSFRDNDAPLRESGKSVAFEENKK